MENLPDPRQCTLVTVFELASGEPAFDVMLYGVTTEDLCVVPMATKYTEVEQWIRDGREGRRELFGSEYVRAALRRRGLDPDEYTSSIFFVRPANRNYAKRRESWENAT